MSFGGLISQCTEDRVNLKKWKKCEINTSDKDFSLISLQKRTIKFVSDVEWFVLFLFYFDFFV